MVEFHRGLIDVLRLLLRLRLGKEDGGGNLSDPVREAFQAFGSAFSPGDLVRMLAQATDLEASGSLRRSAHPRLLLEMLLLRLSYMDRTIELESLLQELGGDGSPAAAGPAPPPPSAHRGKGAGKETGPGRTSRSVAKAPRTKETVASPPVPKATPQPAVEGAQPPKKPGSTLPLPEAWDAVLAGAGSLPPGVLPFLMAAQASFPETGELALTVPPGLGLEKLQEPIVVRALKDALAGLTGTETSLKVVSAAPGDRPPERITEGAVRDGKLKELVDKEPALGEAVQELDLELLD